MNRPSITPLGIWADLCGMISKCAQALADPNVCLEISDDLQGALLDRLKGCIGQWESLARGIPRDPPARRWAFDRLGGTLRAAVRAVERPPRHATSLTQQVSSCLNEAVEWTRSVPSELLILAYRATALDVDNGKIESYSYQQERGAAILTLPLYQPQFGEHELRLLQGGSAMVDSVKHWRDMLATLRSNAYEYVKLIAKDRRDVSSKQKFRDEQHQIGTVKRRLAELGASTEDDPIDTYDPDENGGMRPFQHAGPGLDARLGDAQRRDAAKTPRETPEAAPITGRPSGASNQEFYRELKSVRDQLEHFHRALADPNIRITTSPPLSQMVIRRIEEILGKLESLHRRYRRGLAAETVTRLNRIEGSLRTAARLAKKASSSADPREEIHDHLASCLRWIDSTLTAEQL